MKVLVTGVAGFVGRGLLTRLVAEPDVTVCGIVRSGAVLLPEKVERVVADLAGNVNLNDILHDCNAVMHLAARVHVMRDVAADPLGEFRRANTAVTLSVARQAAAVGVQRFVFLSSIKVNGEGTAPGRAFTQRDEPAPVDAYGVSKLEAERGLQAIATETGMEVVIVRPVLVYGPGVTANFLTLMRALSRGLPLPLGSVKNMRSYLALENLADLLVVVLRHPAAANGIFLVSDGEDLSTSDLLCRLGAALDRPARLIPFPAGLLRGVAGMLGRGDIARRLIGSLQVDIAETRQLLNWSPPITVDEGLRSTAQWFLSSKDAHPSKVRHG